MLKPLFNVLTRKQKVSVLMYHQVLPEFDFMRPFELTVETFRKHLDYMTSNFTLLTMSDAIDKIQNNTLPINPAVMTFDDGYENNASIALPLLREFKVPATFYITSDFLNGGAMWNDKILESVRRWPNNQIDVIVGDQHIVLDVSNEQARAKAGGKLLVAFKYLPLAQRAIVADEFGGDLTNDLQYMMSDKQVKNLFDVGMEIGGHTCTHPILASLNKSKALQQIVDNKAYLENIIGHPLISFAYPNGKPHEDYTQETIELVKQVGYRNAVSTYPGVSNRLTDPYQIPRFTPWRNDRFGFLSLMAKNIYAKDTRLV